MPHLSLFFQSWLSAWQQPATNFTRRRKKIIYHAGFVSPCPEGRNMRIFCGQRAIGVLGAFLTTKTKKTDGEQHPSAFIDRSVYSFPNTGGDAVSSGAHSPVPIAQALGNSGRSDLTRLFVSCNLFCGDCQGIICLAPSTGFQSAKETMQSQTTCIAGGLRKAPEKGARGYWSKSCSPCFLSSTSFCRHNCRMIFPISPRIRPNRTFFRYFGTNAT